MTRVLAQEAAEVFVALVTGALPEGGDQHLVAERGAHESLLAESAGLSPR
jgi:hypothetical protein